jgi:hypothetical protein
MNLFEYRIISCLFSLIYKEPSALVIGVSDICAPNCGSRLYDAGHFGAALTINQPEIIFFFHSIYKI